MKTSDTPRMSPWVMVACGAAIVTLSMGARQAFGLFLLPMSGDIAIDRESFGLAIAIQSLLFGLVQPSVGAAADRASLGIIGQRHAKDADRGTVLKRCLTGRGYNVIR